MNYGAPSFYYSLFSIVYIVLRIICLDNLSVSLKKKKNICINTAKMYDYIRLDNIQGRTFNDVMKDN